MTTEHDLTVKEVAEQMNVSIFTVQRYLREGTLRGYQLSRKSGWRIRPEDLEAFKAARFNTARHHITWFTGDVWNADDDAERAAPLDKDKHYFIMPSENVWGTDDTDDAEKDTAADDDSEKKDK